MEHIIKKFGFINEEQFLSVTKTLSIACGSNLNKTRYKFVKEKGFQTVKSYLTALNKELNKSSSHNLEKKESIDDLYFTDYFSELNFMKERKLIYFTEDSICIETAIHKAPNVFQNEIDYIAEEISKDLTGTDLLHNVKTYETHYPNVLVLTGEYSYKDIINNNVNVTDFADKLNTYFKNESCFSLFLDHLCLKVNPGYIGMSDDIINFKLFKGFLKDIDIKYKKIIATSFFWSRTISRNNAEHIEHRALFLKNMVITAIQKQELLFTNGVSIL